MWFPSTKWKRSSVSVVPRPGNQQTPFGVWPDDAEDPNRRGLGRESTHHLGTMRPRGHVVHREIITWEGSGLGLATCQGTEDSRKVAGEECHWIFLTYVTGRLLTEASRKENNSLQKQKQKPFLLHTLPSLLPSTSNV